MSKTQSDITEGNKLIAEFMGVSHAAGDNGLFYYINGDSYDTLEYHTSWDWLMPVVEKIGEQTGCITMEAILRKLTDYYKKIICNRHQLWEAVICYIQFYNQHQ